jgi:hypothetical protein
MNGKKSVLGGKLLFMIAAESEGNNSNLHLFGFCVTQQKHSILRKMMMMIDVE